MNLPKLGLLPQTAIDKEHQEVSDELLEAIIRVNNPTKTGLSLIGHFEAEGIIKRDADGELIPFHLIAEMISKLHIPKKPLDIL